MEKIEKLSTLKIERKAKNNKQNNQYNMRCNR